MWHIPSEICGIYLQRSRKCLKPFHGNFILHLNELLGDIVKSNFPVFCELNNQVVLKNYLSCFLDSISTKYPIPIGSLQEEPWHPVLVFLLSESDKEASLCCRWLFVCYRYTVLLLQSVQWSFTQFSDINSDIKRLYLVSHILCKPFSMFFWSSNVTFFISLYHPLNIEVSFFANDITACNRFQVVSCFPFIHCPCIPACELFASLCFFSASTMF